MVDLLWLGLVEYRIVDMFWDCGCVYVYVYECFFSWVLLLLLLFLCLFPVRLSVSVTHGELWPSVLVSISTV